MLITISLKLYNCSIVPSVLYDLTSCRKGNHQQYFSDLKDYNGLFECII